MKATGLHQFPDTPQSYANWMREAGFENVSHSDASNWYRIRAAEELKELTGPQFDKAAELTSEEMRNSIIKEWRALNLVLQSGDLKTGYFRSRKPG